MKLPVIQGVIRRRMLVNFRVAASVVERLLPAGFRPKLHAGYAVAGICLIRLEQIRPRGLPRCVGVRSENAAHRIAVVCDDRSGEDREAVFITRRDTDSRLNQLLGGRFFPGEHHAARFDVRSGSDRIELSMRSADERAEIEVAGRVRNVWPAASISRSVDEASAYFERGRLGYSVTRDPRRLDGIVLQTRDWRVRPLDVEHVRSSFFDDRSRFPRGSVEFDHALFMSDVDHEWHAAEPWCA